MAKKTKHPMTSAKPKDDESQEQPNVASTKEKANTDTDKEMTALEFGSLSGFNPVDKSAVNRKYKLIKKTHEAWTKEFRNKIKF